MVDEKHQQASNHTLTIQPAEFAKTKKSTTQVQKPSTSYFGGS